VDDLLAFEGDGVVRHFVGNYSEYLEKRREELAREVETAKQKAEADASQARASGRGGNRTRKLSYKDQKEWEEIEGKIAALEERSARLKKEIVEAGSDFEKAQKLYEEEQQVSAELEQAIERWAELSALIEEMEAGK
jgi:ATP-binding cassette subfamily F protein uup